MPTPTLLQRLKERKLVQWAFAYLAGAWLVVQALDALETPLGLSANLQRAVLVFVIVGFFITLVLAWYHGEKGRQRVSGLELLVVAALLVAAGVGLSMVGREPRVGEPTDQLAIDEVESVAAALNRLPGIAVLPFNNLSGVPDDQYFTEGMHGEILTRLSKISGLSVRGQTSVMEYRDSPKNLREIGEELNARYIVEGGVQRAGGTVRINVQLIEAATDEHLWADTFDREMSLENLFDIQSEIVRTVAGHLDIELREEERLRAARRSTKDLEAYDFFMRAFAEPLGSEDAIALLQEAVGRDPGFVVAHATLSMRQTYQYRIMGRRSEEQAAAARAAAERAVELAPESEDAQVAMGTYLYYVERDYEGALDWLSRASGSLFGDYQYHSHRAHVERAMGHWREALASFEAAVSLSPRSRIDWTNFGSTYVFLRRYAEAGETLLEAQKLDDAPLAGLALLTWFRDGTTDGWRPYLERDPTSQWAWEIPMTEGRYEDAMAVLQDLPDGLSGGHLWCPNALLEAETLEALGRHEAARQKYQDAADILERLLEETPNDERYSASLARAYAGLGRRDEAVRQAQRALEIMPRERHALTGPESLFNLAAVHARLGEVEEALEVLEDLLSAPSRYAPNMLEDHFRLRPIHDDPRFQALIDRERDRVF